MADQRIRIRLVPKNAEGRSLRDFAAPMSPEIAKAYAPSRDLALRAEHDLSAMGMNVQLSPKHVLEVDADQDSITSVFGVRLKTETRELGSRGVGKESYMIPVKELEVPEGLRDSIEFAYVPTPPIFFGIDPIPPTPSIFHLRIDDVMRTLGAARCHRRGWTGRGVRLAMTDSGFSRHAFFDQMGFNVQRFHTPTTEHPAIDNSGHGTGESANALIMAPDCQLLAIKHDDYSVEAIETALSQSPQVITNSWGWDIDQVSKTQLKTDNPNLYNEVIDLEQTLADAIDDGVVVVFSAGNGHRAFPGSMPHVISVGGVTVGSDGDMEASTYASSFRSQLYPGRGIPDFCGIVGESSSSPMKGHIMLPVANGAQLEGENLPNNSSNRGWGIFSGTSAAAPQVAGVVALMLSINPSLTPLQIKTILADAAIDVTKGNSANGDSASAGADEATGTGLVDAFAACMRVEQLMMEP